MRQAIETAPRDGTIVILEDDVSGTYDTAHWSRKRYQWVGENGEPSKMTPTHWYPRPRDKYLLRQDDGSPRRFTAWSIAAVLIAMLIIGAYFRADIAGYVSQSAGLQNVFGNSRLRVAEQQTPQTGKAKPTPEALPSLEQQPADSLANDLAETRLVVDRLTLQLRAETANSAQSLGQEREKAASLAQEADTARRELSASHAQYRQTLDEERARSAALSSELTAARREIETQATQLRKASSDTGRLKQADAARISQSLELERQKAVSFAQEAASARQELTESTAQHRRVIDEERARSVALANELAAARSEIERNAAVSKANEAAWTSAQSLEREKAVAMAGEAEAARQDLTESTAQYRKALDEERDRRAVLWSELATAQQEIETLAAQLRKASDEMGRVKQTAEQAMAELRQSLQQERDRATALARNLSAGSTGDVPITPDPALNRSAVAATATARPAVVEADAIRLIARASALLGQGDIGAARIVLERAAEAGSAEASFMLAETYDPIILSGWGTYGTRAEVTKAREFYAKARAGGIQEATDRFNALVR